MKAESLLLESIPPKVSHLSRQMSRQNGQQKSEAIASGKSNEKAHAKLWVCLEWNYSFPSSRESSISILGVKKGTIGDMSGPH
jgi:hypothetical protein